jgi:hypothetical protein
MCAVANHEIIQDRYFLTLRCGTSKGRSWESFFFIFTWIGEDELLFRIQHQNHSDIVPTKIFKTSNISTDASNQELVNRSGRSYWPYPTRNNHEFIPIDTYVLAMACNSVQRWTTNSVTWRNEINMERWNKKQIKQEIHILLFDDCNKRL